MAPWRVGMLGAGMMAQGFDRPGSPRILSMAHAFSRSTDFVIGGFFDARADRAEAAEEVWGVAPSPRTREAWLAEPWDVVYIATPDAQHGRDVCDALARQPRGLLVEKPLASDGREAIDLLRKAGERRIPLMVNFPRRWHSGVVRLGDMAAAGRVSAPLSAFVAISGGALHSLPHTVDMVHSIWGGGWTVQRVAPRAGEMSLLDWRRNGQTFAMVVAERGSPHYVWEAHFYCPEGKVEFSHSPEVLEWSAPAPHPEYHTYQVLTPVFRADMEQEPLLGRAVEALARAIADPAAAERTLDRELESHSVAASVLPWFEV
jgi:predicted dehydrogenase